MHISIKLSISLVLLLCCAVYQSHGSLSSEDACICGRMYSPVCGSDSITYDNPCLFECARKKLSLKGRSLTMARAGACATLEQVRNYVADEDLVEVAADEVDTDLVNCICDRSFEPVCGSDNRTYGNRCLFDCKRSILARLGKVLSLLREAACT